MRHLNVFRSLTSAEGRLGFYTKETRNKIPEFPGCYAWFLPLWLYRNDLDDLMQVVSELLSYDRVSEKEVYAHFTWESVKLRVRRCSEIRSTDGVRPTWQRILADDEAREALQQALMEATLLMPPLYVGRTNNLKRRYLQHTEREGSERNDFRSRFREQADKLELKVGVNDLLFVCVQTPKELSRVFANFEEDEINGLFEQILMHFCRPPFSLR